MIALAHRHPVQLVLGQVLLAAELSQKRGQLTFASMCETAVTWAIDTRDLLREIATDAEYLSEQIVEAASDGVFTAEERERLRGYAIEIREEAVTGKIINARA